MPTKMSILFQQMAILSLFVIIRQSDVHFLYGCLINVLFVRIHANFYQGQIEVVNIWCQHLLPTHTHILT